MLFAPMGFWVLIAILDSVLPFIQILKIALHALAAACRAVSEAMLPV